MQTLNVDLGARSYPIHIGSGLIADISLIAPHIKGRQVMIVSNTTVAPLYLDQLKTTLGDQYQVAEVILPDGEAYKTLDSVNLIFNALLENRFNRTCTLIALGGGVIGDMTGFAAASYQRGVNFIQIPTTLLSQVDSSVGGKTGVNHPLGKNMIGAFWQPQLVLADTDTLQTLPDRELAAGIAEVIKYGLIRDADFFSWLESNVQPLKQKNSIALSEAIYRSCQNKAEVVTLDELEGGVRATLNLGHTFGHAIETEQGYGQWLHGEAVATGMFMAADLSGREGWLSQGDVARIKALLEKFDLPIAPPESMTAETFIKHMLVDKKVLDGNLRLVLMTAFGKSVVTEQFSAVNLQQTLAAGKKLGFF
ncbi:3-dehydroquinate synthase [Oceanospirillum linum]|uniref:3-dehydroquinate synthase n=1 Tax=Oceanospirillum linum TaxID=966 RepID=A0A1T1H8E3_OCELI|nr:3-dehydroquinate synthase [Oceanospirillum linum]OOV86144.1 3-dehydroquinate synthase [Oceanospirillum linum]SEG42285.1 3-dehydroquinate synthase [Oleiphilus messinensis]SMP33187.1 3-dehydroquinate synthase [Oceanospirillum linum]